MHFDGSRQLQGSGAGVDLTSPKGEKFFFVLQLQFTCTNNVEEYEALLHGLRLAREMNINWIQCYGDSDLVSQQVSGKWDSKKSHNGSLSTRGTKTSRIFCWIPGGPCGP